MEQREKKEEGNGNEVNGLFCAYFSFLSSFLSRLRFTSLKRNEEEK